MKHCQDNSSIPSYPPVEYRVRCRLYDHDNDDDQSRSSTLHNVANSSQAPSLSAEESGRLLAAGAASGCTVVGNNPVATGASVGRSSCVLPLPHCLSPWSAERPKLYTLLLVLETRSAPDRDGSGGSTSGHVHDGSNGGGQGWAVQEATAVRVGFRTSEVRQGRLLVNGYPVILKGANRHEFDPAAGHVLSEQGMVMDVLLMKALNFNAVRCSHYPPDSAFLEACDRLGKSGCDRQTLAWGSRGRPTLIIKQTC